MYSVHMDLFRVHRYRKKGDVVKLVEGIVCDSCEVSIYNLNNKGQDKARAYGITSVPTVVVDGKIADCCRQGKVSKSELVAAGIGKQIS